VFSCNQVLAELANYLDDHLAAEIRRELETHLSHCQTCRALFDSTRKTITIVTESRSFELPESVSARILEKIKARMHQGGKPRHPKRSEKSSKRR
jgi:anti-sigma factor RsiW